MILIGQYDSPFVRRVAVALRLYGLAYEHRPWSVFADAARIAAYNPLHRVPTLVLDDGAVVIESAAILDYLDEQVGARRAMLPASGVARRAALYRISLAMGLCDKAVALLYETRFHAEVSPDWVARGRAQIRAVLNALEAEFDDAPADCELYDHAGVAVGCALRFLADAHGGWLTVGDWPVLTRHSARCEAQPAFAGAIQSFVPPG